MGTTRQVNPNKLTPPAEVRIVEREYRQEHTRQREALRERYENNAEVQRNRQMSKQERAREAISIMTGKIKEYNDFKAGRDTTEREAEKKAREIASRALGERV